MKLIARIKAEYAAACSFFGYLKRRLGERSTWLAISGGIAGAAALEMPWAAASVIVAVIMAMLPEAPKQQS